LTGGRLVLLASSPRVAPGLLGADAWDALRSADQVWYGLAEHPQLAALRHAGVVASHLAEGPRIAADRLLAAAASGVVVVFLLDPAGEPAWSTAIGEALTIRAAAGTGSAPELELLAGSYDLPGAHLLDLVAVMDRLRSPGGCPWDAKQTHQSLVRYLVEEAYELVEAIESGDRDHLREELGDVLLQVVFHARVAADDASDPFDVDDVADGIVAKLVGRHPHVFGDAEARTAEHVEANWDRIKTAEKGRTSVLDGIPPGLPALAAAEKLLGRVARAELDVPLPEPGSPADPVGLGDTLLSLVAGARAAGLDPEAELRRAVRRHADRTRAAEGQ
jgi:XTP/dITP diphosphohydrolase